MQFKFYNNATNKMQQKYEAVEPFVQSFFSQLEAVERLSHAYDNNGRT